jgi:hypothetical protein
MTRTSLARVVITAMLLVPLTWAAWQNTSTSAAGQDDQPAAPAAWPPELDMIPRDALGFLSIQVAVLWNDPALANLRGGQPGDDDPALARGFRQSEAEFEEQTGVRPSDLQRVSVVARDLNHEPAVIFTTVKPFARPKVLQTLVPDAKEMKHEDRSYFVSERRRASLYPVNEHSFILGSTPSVEAWVKADQPNTKGPLSAALRLATQKHLVVGGVNPAVLAKNVPMELPPPLQPLQSLLTAQAVTLTVDAGMDLRTHLHLDLPANEAKAGAEALEAAITLARQPFSQVIQAMSKDVPDAPTVVKVFKELESALKNAKVKQEGGAVDVNLRARIDVTTLVSAQVEAAIKVRAAANRMQSQNNLKQMALAFHNFNDVNGKCPAAAIASADGKPLLSWRVAILPYLEAGELYKEFKLDEPWDSAHNKKLLAKMPLLYAQPGTKTKEPYTTFYQVFVGKDTPFVDGKAPRIPTTFTDGTSNTIMLVEAAEAVPWTKPEDLPYDAEKPLPKLGGKTGFIVAFWDGSVRMLSKDIDEKTLRALITPNGGEVIDPDKLR